MEAGGLRVHFALSCSTECSSGPNVSCLRLHCSILSCTALHCFQNSMYCDQTVQTGKYKDAKNLAYPFTQVFGTLYVCNIKKKSYCNH